jgi:hypothetical protein
MRSATILFLLTLFAVLVLAQTSSLPERPLVPQVLTALGDGQSASRNSGDGVYMWRRAEIQVVPLDLAAANKVELESLRGRVAQLEANSQKLDLSDLAVREQVFRQLQLLKELLSYTESLDSDRGKSPSAIQVQRHLNQIEGQTMCAACHATTSSIGAGR